jgi:hypothetical protein
MEDQGYDLAAIPLLNEEDPSTYCLERWGWSGSAGALIHSKNTKQCFISP